MRRVVIVIVLVLAALPASAAALVGAAELARQPVVVEAGAGVAADERAALASASARLTAAGSPTRFVVLATRPADIVAYATALRRDAGYGGAVIVLALDPRRPGIGISSPAGRARAQAAYTASLPQLRTDPILGAIAVADRLASPGSGPAAGDARDTGPGWSGLVLLGVLGAGGAGAILLTRRRRRRAADDRVREEREALEPLVDALAVKVGDLDSDVPLGGERGERARPHADEATLAYGEAREALPKAASSPALDAVRATLERGLRAAARAEALLEGRQAPADEPLVAGLCAFDPSHGRAVTTARYVTPAGDEAEVPVCRADADALAAGAQPDVRTVARGGRQVPYWQGAGLGGFGGALFPVLGGVFGGLMLYDLLTPDVGFGAGGDAFGAGGDLGGFDGAGGDTGGFGGDFGGDLGGGGDF